MKKIFLIATCVLGFATIAAAQNNAYQSVVGVMTDAAGNSSFISPTTAIAVDITIEKEQNIVGPYARYAQKYLDTRGSLIEKTTYHIVDAQVALTKECHTLYCGGIEADKTTIASHNGSETEFAKILPSRLQNTTQSLDAAAMEAAQAIFDIRKARMDLITGEAGENVFGGGLKDALEALDKQEEALMELFFGKNIVSTHTKRFYIAIDANNKEYPLARFSKNTGLQDIDANAGDVIILSITPSGEIKTEGVTPADPKAKEVMQIRCADLSNCSVKLDEEVLASKRLPIFEFGKTITIAK